MNRVLSILVFGCLMFVSSTDAKAQSNYHFSFITGYEAWLIVEDYDYQLIIRRANGSEYIHNTYETRSEAELRGFRMEEHGAIPPGSWRVRQVRGDNHVLWDTYDTLEEAEMVIANFDAVFGIEGYVKPVSLLLPARYGNMSMMLFGG